MRKILEILFIDRKEHPEKGSYFKTTALLDDGTEATGYGKDFQAGNEVEVFLDKRWDVIKMRLPLDKRH